MSGPLPTHFRWLWYLVGLAGMVLSVIGILAILGSAADLGILIPLVVVGAVVIGYLILRFKRSIDAAVAAAPSRQSATADPTGSSPTAAGETVDPDRTPSAPGASAGSAAATPAKPTGDQPRTSRR